MPETGREFDKSPKIVVEGSSPFGRPEPSPFARKMQQEQGGAPIDQTDNNKFKFPDTFGPKPWYPIDKPTGSPDFHFQKEDRPGGWGVHYFDKAPIRIPLPGDVNGPNGPNGGGKDKPVLNPDQIQKPRMTDDEARNSVLQNVDARSIYLTAGATGAAMKYGTHYADVRSGAIDPELRTGAAKYWRDNFSPAQRVVPERRAIVSGLEQALPQLRTDLDAASHIFTRQKGLQTEWVARLKGEIPNVPMADVEKAWWNARVELVAKNELFTPVNIAANTGTAEQVAQRVKLFTHTEATPIVADAGNLIKADMSQEGAKVALAQNERATLSATQDLVRAERGSLTTGSNSLLRGIGQGMVIATVAVAADGILDKTLGNDPNLSNSAHWGIQGIGMPLLLLSKYSPQTKVLGSLAMVAGSHALDHVAGPPTGAFGLLARPSLPEIGLATAGALAPVGDRRINAGLAVGGWLLGKAWNVLDDRYGWTGPSEQRQRSEALAALNLDISKPSRERFSFATDQMKQFTDRNEAGAVVMITDWQKQNNASSQIEYDRANAALMKGYGESELERGTRVDQNKWDKDGRRILAGSNFDFGGEATNYLRAANGSLNEAIRLSKENIGKDIGSGKITPDYINQLEYSKTKNEEILERVYGGHDIPVVYDAVSRQVSAHTTAMKEFGENLAQYVKKVSDNEPHYKAKLYRDLTILHVAFAEHDQDSGGHTEHYRKALGYMTQANGLDSKAPDQEAVSALVTGASRFKR